jgi:hypothetical protein
MSARRQNRSEPQAFTARPMSVAMSVDMAGRVSGAAPAPAVSYAENGFDPKTVVDFAGVKNSGTEYYRTGGADSDFATMLTHSRAGNATMADSDGNLKWAPHNLVLNSASPATQSITVTSGVDYTVEITGTGSVTLSGAGTGTVTAGNPVEITASTTSLTLTVSGSPSTMWAYRSDLGGMVNNPDTGTSYVATTGTALYLARRNAYRYNGTSWVNAGVLLETEAATNLIDDSNDFAAAGWSITGSNSVTLTADDSTGSDGQSSMTRVAITDTTSENHQFFETLTSSAADEKVVLAWEFKAGAGTIFPAIVLQWDANESAAACYNLSAGTVSSTNTTGVATLHSSGIIDLGGGIYRGWIVASTSATRTNMYLRCMTADSATPTWGVLGNLVYAGTAGDHFFAAFSQCEVGTLPSSYIPTNGATATRVAETLDVNNAQLTLGADVSIALEGRSSVASWANNRIVELLGAGSDRILLWSSSGNSSAYLQNTTIITSTAGALPTGALQELKIAGRFDGSTAVQTALGGTAGTAITASVPAIPTLAGDLKLYRGAGSADVNGFVGMVRVWDADIATAGIESATT